MATFRLSTCTSAPCRAALLGLACVGASLLSGCQAPWRGWRGNEPSLEELLVHPEPWDADARLVEQSGRRVSAPTARQGSRANPYASAQLAERSSPADRRRLDDREEAGLAREDDAGDAERSDTLSEEDFAAAYAAAPPHLRPLLKRQWQATLAAADSDRQARPRSAREEFPDDRSPSDRSPYSRDESSSEESPDSADRPVRFSLSDDEDTGVTDVERSLEMDDDRPARSHSASQEREAKAQRQFEELNPPAGRKTSRQVAHADPIDTGVKDELNLKANSSRETQVAQSKSGPQNAAVADAVGGQAQASAVAPAAATLPVPADSSPLASANATASSSAPAGGNSAAAAPEKEMSWHDHVREALRLLESETESASASPAEQLNSQAIARMLHLSLGDLEPALKPIEGLQPAEQDFFRHEFQALHDAIDPRGNPVLARRWTLVMDSQRQATAHLGAVSNLEIKNAAFCSNVDGFGAVTRFPTANFRPKQEVLLYCELENFVSLPVKDGFQTVLQGSYEIVDASGHRVFEALLSEDSDICRHQRRDYFIAYRIYMPDNLAAGRYQLRLTIEDMKGRKFGQSSLDFAITQ